MKRKNRPSSPISSLIFIGLLFSAGCASTPPENIIFHDNYNSVRLDPVRGKEKDPNPIRFNHPAQFTEEEMGSLLGSIQVVQPPGFFSRVVLKNRALPEPAFTEKEIERFAPVFVKAFSRAGPEERIVFFLHHQRSIYKGRTSSGVAFIKDGRFNMVFGRFLRGNQPGKPDIDVQGKPLPSSRDQDFYLYAGDHQKLITEKRFPTTREIIFPKRWVTIDTVALLEAPEPETREVSLEEAASGDAGAEPAAASPRQPGTESLEDKLRTLKRLFEEGLITEEEYNRKKETLLADF